jgi:hypothetical protein
MCNILWDIGGIHYTLSGLQDEGSRLPRCYIHCRGATWSLLVRLSGMISAGRGATWSLSGGLCVVSLVSAIRLLCISAEEILYSSGDEVSFYVWWRLLLFPGSVHIKRLRYIYVYTTWYIYVTVEWIICIKIAVWDEHIIHLCGVLLFKLIRYNVRGGLLLLCDWYRQYEEDCVRYISFSMWRFILNSVEFYDYDVGIGLSGKDMELYESLCYWRF